MARSPSHDFYHFPTYTPPCMNKKTDLLGDYSYGHSRHEIDHYMDEYLQ
jgi:hypothetical protein